MMRSRFSLVLAILAAASLAPAVAMAATVEIKLATLAPKGSAWAKIMAKGAADVEAKTAFPLHAPTPVPETATPTDAELTLLRGAVREELQTFYPEFVKQQS